jgi:hypothetical protein
MVAHQDVAVDLAAVLCRGLPKALKIEAIILVSKKDRLAVIAALHDMLWYTRYAYTRPPRHVGYHALPGHCHERIDVSKVDWRLISQLATSVGKVDLTPISENWT